MWYTYQKTITNQLPRTRAIVALDTGTGKTKITLDAIHLLNEPATIICPAFLCQNWRAEAEKWGCEVPLTIRSYDTLHKAPASNILVFDEAHYLRNHTTKRAKASLELVKKSNPHTLLFLTATPLLRSAENLFPLLKMIAPSKVPKLAEYRALYCNRKPNRFTFDGWEWYGVKEEFWPYVHENFTLITLKKEDVLALPEKRYERVSAKVSPKHHLVNHKTTEAELTAKILAGGGMGDHIAVMRRELGEEKAVEAVKIIQDYQEKEPCQFVAWCHHRSVADILSRALDSCVITGETPMRERNTLVEKFQSGLVKSLICTCGAAGVGITLTQGRRMYWVEKPYLYSDLKQAEDRMHRIGQEYPLEVVEIHAPKTIDDPIEKNLTIRKEMHEELYGTNTTRKVQPVSGEKMDRVPSES